ncbi:hypothetical protein L0Y69_00900 [bacterium]|nr:hypothetical protein [bacterium]
MNEKIETHSGEMTAEEIAQWKIFIIGALIAISGEKGIPLPEEPIKTAGGIFGVSFS